MHRRISIFAAVVAVALGALVAVATATGAGSARRVHVVTTAKSAALGTSVLVDLKGRTLYSLSAERNGRFICTDKTCLSFWHPLVVGAHDTPVGASRLGTVKRPDGRRQVTFRGGPLYTFSGDRRRGDAKGEGFKDVGTWHAAAFGGSQASTPAPTTTSGGGGGGYGGYGY